MRENKKEREELKASRPKNFINEQKEGPFIMSNLGAFIANPSYKILKNQKQKLLQGDKTGRKQKSDQNKSKSQKQDEQSTMLET